MELTLTTTHETSLATHLHEDAMTSPFMATSSNMTSHCHHPCACGFTSMAQSRFPCGEHTSSMDVTERLHAISFDWTLIVSIRRHRQNRCCCQTPHAEQDCPLVAISRFEAWHRWNDIQCSLSQTTPSTATISSIHGVICSVGLLAKAHVGAVSTTSLIHSRRRPLSAAE
jgi:hypothetical protein